MQKNKPKTAVLFRFLLVLMLLLGGFQSLVNQLPAASAASSPRVAPAAAPAAAQVLTKTLQLKVVSARTESNWVDPATNIARPITKGTPAATFKFIINENDTGNPLQPRYPYCSPTLSDGSVNPDYPAPIGKSGLPNFESSHACQWPSIQPTDAFSPIVAQGDETIFANGGTLDLSKVPNGKYLVSVWADGFKIDGKYFDLPFKVATATDPGVVTVEAQPFPLPLATIKLQVFEDRNPVNGQYDIPGEIGQQGFEGHITDILGVVKSDWYGNPICTVYQTVNGKGQFDPATGIATGDPVKITNGKPVISALGGKCLSDANGEITIPNLGPNRYTATVVPPIDPNFKWVQTTTLEGNHDYDVWVQEGSTGYDTEMIGPNGEAVPAIPFGYVKTTSSPAGLSNAPTTGTSAITGGIKGIVLASKTYVPQQGGIPYNGQGGVGALGNKIDGPIDRPWIALNDLQRGDTPVYVGQGDSQGKFAINNVPDGDYALTYWDASQDFLLDFINVSVVNGQVTDMNNLILSGWWTTYSGRVCYDTNQNGKCDPGEPGIPNLTLQLLSRANSLIERGQPTATTDNQGNYVFREAYPLSAWLVMQMYNDRFKTVGITYQADNQPTETTTLTSAVDIGVFPVIGLSGRVDWALNKYDTSKTENGGIVGTVTYDTTRNELDARFAATEVYQPGIPGVEVKLWATKPCPSPIPTGVTCDPSNTYQTNADGSYAKKYTQPLNTYTSEHWQRPTGCMPRDINALPLVQKVTPADPQRDCIEAPFMGIQFDPNSNKVNGNFGFTTSKRDPVTGKFYKDPQGNIIEQPLPAGDYIVEVVIPNDKTGKPMYQVTREEDINVFTGDVYTSQVPPPACVGPMHTVDVKGIGADGPDAVSNPGFVAAGGSPYEGQLKPLCNMKLVTLQVGRSIVPNFNLFTQVPIPGKMWGLINDDLNLSTNPQDIMFGEKRGLANVPIGIYDYSNRFITTIMSDPNGFYEILLPSTSTYNCPLPAGPCPNVYRLVGNDPGQPGNLNPYYNPNYKTISASFEVWPGLVMPADHAPIPIGAMIATPGSQNNQPAQCKLDNATPQLMSIKQAPYLRTTDPKTPNGAYYSQSVTIEGDGFGASTDVGTVQLVNSVGVTTSLKINNWKNTAIAVQLPSSIAPGEYQLQITAKNGQIAPTGLTYHVLGGAYNPQVFEVGPGKAYDPNKYSFPYTNATGPIQKALDEAASINGPALVVVYPGEGKIPTNPNGNSLFNANGAYFENLLINSAVKLQGVGPGGIRADKSTVNGSVIDGLGSGNETYGDAWRVKAESLRWAGNQTLFEGAVVTILAPNQGPGIFGSSYKAKIDGFLITGGDQKGQNTKANSVPGGIVTTQGGGIFANAYASSLQITNNLIRSNGGAYGGGIRLGTPFETGNKNNDIRIAYNRIIANGGTNLAGGVGIFNDADNYEIDHNDVCGNYSGEYGGGISQYGKVGGLGKIHNNRIYFNASFDEGGGIKIGGEVPANPLNLSPGTGTVDIYNNLIQDNLANDDGGGIRLLMVENFQIKIYNNQIVNNISTHEGGGISLDDAPLTAIYNNTIMKNLTTATAATSNGQRAPAGISTAANSVALGGGFSNPVLFNNILWDNRAGQWDFVNLTLKGIGLQGASDIYNWDMGTADNSGTLSPVYSLYQSTEGVSPASVTGNIVNPASGPQVVNDTYNVSVSVFPWRTSPTFIGTAIVATELPPNLMGDFGLKSGSPALNAGTSGVTVNGQTFTAPPTAVDTKAVPPPPSPVTYDMGANLVP